jgi:orotate phosphoribosyltransferase-like protein
MRISDKRNKNALENVYRKAQFSQNVQQAQELRKQGHSIAFIANELRTTEEIVRIWLLEFDDA